MRLEGRLTGRGIWIILSVSLALSMLIFLFAYLNPASAGEGLWENMGLYGGGVTSALVDPDSGAVYLVLNGAPGFYRSDDDGATWYAPPDIQYSAAQRLIRDSQGAIYANFGPGFMRSQDGGYHWDLLATSYICQDCFTIPGFDVGPGDTSHIVIGTGNTGTLSDGSAYVSWDAGQTWKRSNLQTGPNEDVVSVVFDLEDPTGGTVYAAVNTGWGPMDQPSYIYLSLDGGETYSRTFTAALGEQVYVVAGAPGGGAFAGTSQNLYRTQDGLSWHPVFTGSQPTISFISLSPVDSQVIYASNYRSTDGGLSWQPFNASSFMAQSTLNPDLLLTGSPVGIQRSLDGGQTWQEANHGIESVGVWTVDGDPKDNQILFVASGSGIGRSLDGGVSWDFPLPGLIGGFKPLALDPYHPGEVYAGSGNQFYRLTDWGAAWTNDIVQPFEDQSVYQILVDPLLSDHVYLALTSFNPVTESAEGALARSIDGGQTWLTSTLDGPSVNALVAGVLPGGAVLYAGIGDFYHPDSPGGVYRSLDSGKTWTLLGLENLNIMELALDPDDPNRIYAAAGNVSGQFGGIPPLNRSLNGGQTWEPMGLQECPGASALVVDPNDPQTLYVSCWNSLFRSRDGGLSFSLYYEARPGDQIQSIYIPLLPPPAPQAFQAEPVSDTIRLTWDTPANEDIVATMLRVMTDTFPASHTQGLTLTVELTGDSLTGVFTHTGVLSGTTYYYGAFSIDGKGRYSQPAWKSAALGAHGLNRILLEDRPAASENQTPDQKAIYVSTSLGLYRLMEAELPYHIFLPNVQP